MKNTELIVMLTYNDYTVSNALEIFDACRHTSAEYWGAKEQGIPRKDLKKLFTSIRESGKTAVLEVVAYTEDECLAGAKTAVECGCDMLLGTKYFDSVHELCRENNIRYLPFVGQVSGRPSVLEGSIEEMLSETEEYRRKGVCGVDLLGYRYRGSSSALCSALVNSGLLPVCLAGSINDIDRLQEVRRLRPDFFTIGSAFLENRFGGDIAGQIEFVCSYMNTPNE